MIYHLWAEHTAGASVDHPCRTGIYSDPTDHWSVEVQAKSEAAAQKIGAKRLRNIVERAEPCKCERHLSPGWDRWWASVSIIASRTPYPVYTSDEATP